MFLKGFSTVLSVFGGFQVFCLRVFQCFFKAFFFKGLFEGLF